jgi:hypothetical protein
MVVGAERLLPAMPELVGIAPMRLDVVGDQKVTARIRLWRPRRSGACRR